MPDLRVLVAAAIHAVNLAQNPLRETPVDRLGALAFADPLGGDLWALKYANEASAFAPALGLLTHRSRKAARDFVLRRKLCTVALHEWMFDLCQTCGGRGVRVATQFSPVRHCETCDGSGRQQISEAGRARALGFELGTYRKWAPRFALVQGKISDAEDQAWLDISRQLGRLDADLTLRLNALRRPRLAI